MLDQNVPTLPPDVFASVVNALADTLIRDYRERWSHRVAEAIPASATAPAATSPSPWLTVADAAKRAQCARSTIYSEVQAGRLRAAKVGGGRILRIRPEWVDEWLQAEPRR